MKSLKFIVIGMSLLWLAGCDFMRDFEGRWYEGHADKKYIFEEEVVLLTLPDAAITKNSEFPKHTQSMMFERPGKTDRNRLIIASFHDIPYELIKGVQEGSFQVGKSYKIDASYIDESNMYLTGLCNLSPNYLPCNKGYERITIGFYGLESIEPIP